ncbi:hypothetical protein F4778DRAFT_783424 [Xylariomycetidae sp. FL2044]|nr:hypothetical protein F4778DRAFT_783424 [Xylariomycetidae sp. FL2044]
MPSETHFLFLLAASTAWGAPQNFLGYGGGGYTVPNCEWDTKLLTAKTEVYDGTSELLAWTCTSSVQGTCSLTEQATYSHSTSWSVGGGLDAKFKVGKAFELSPKFQFGYSWTDTSGESHSARVTCPEGGMKCGLVATPSICKITGDAEAEWDDAGKASDCNDDLPGKSTYKIESICMRGDSKNQDMNAVTDFEACVMECNKEDRCDKEKANLMKPCPGVKGYPFK